MGQVTWDERALSRAYRPEDVFLRISFDDAAVALDQVAGWIEDFNSRHAGSGEVGLSGPVDLPGDACIVAVAWADSRAAYQRAVTELVAVLTAAATASRIELTKNSYPTVGTPRVPFFNTAVAVSPHLRDEVRAHGARLYSREHVDPMALAAVVDYALTWCRVDAGRHYVQTDVLSQLFDPDSRDTTVRMALARPRQAVKAVATAWPGETRVVAFDAAGRVHFQFGTGAGAARLPDPLARAQTLLRDLAPHIASGFAVPSTERTPNAVQTITVAWGDREDIPAYQLGATRRLDDRRIYDAFPVLFLGAGFADEATSLPDYDTMLIDAGGRLLTHRRAHDWLLGLTEPAVDRAAARAHLEGALLSPGDVEAEVAAISHL
jgi:hypothetical protein